MTPTGVEVAIVTMKSMLSPITVRGLGEGLFVHRVSGMKGAATAASVKSSARVSQSASAMYGIRLVGLMDTLVMMKLNVMKLVLVVPAGALLVRPLMRVLLSCWMDVPHA